MMTYEEPESAQENFIKFIYQLQPKIKTLVRKLKRRTATQPHTHTRTRIYIYIYVCVCVCVCVILGKTYNRTKNQRNF